MRLDKENIDTLNALCNVVRAHKDYLEFLNGVGIKVTYEPEAVKDLDVTHVIKKMQEILVTHGIAPKE